MASTVPGQIKPAPLPTTDQTVCARIVFSFPRTPVERGEEPADKDLMQVSEIRRNCGAKLRHWGLGQFTDSAQLLLSELVTNAIWHGSGSQIGVRLSRISRAVRIEVWGGPVSALTVRTPDLLDEDGRGLLLVDTIADAWGVDDADWVWCTLATARDGR